MNDPMGPPLPPADREEIAIDPQRRRVRSRFGLLLLILIAGALLWAALRYLESDQDPLQVDPREEPVQTGARAG